MSENMVGLYLAGLVLVAWILSHRPVSSMTSTVSCAAASSCTVETKGCGPVIEERRLVGSGSRWGPGKTHRAFYGGKNRGWYVVCRGPYADTPQGEIVKEAVITCKKCEATVPMPSEIEA